MNVLGTTIDFTFVIDKDSSYAENIRVRGFENLEQKPLELRRLKFLSGLAAPESRAGVLTAQQRVPDFVLTDQNQQRVRFSALAGWPPTLPSSRSASRIVSAAIWCY
jgi:hypothetical protein